jgi:Na+-transporting NADH:ubiquinone oxidoreductase subunit A
MTVNQGKGMQTIRLKKGLNLKMTGDPVPALFDGPEIQQVALIGPDYPGLKPAFEAKVGDSVRLGQLLFTDKKCPAIRFTSPGSGRIQSINRGHRRAFLSIVIDLDGNEALTFKSHPAGKLSSLNAEQVRNQLLESGLWTALRSRPFGRVANPGQIPHSVFVTAMDTNPLAPDIQKILEGRETDFKNGCLILTRLTEGRVIVCQATDAAFPLPQHERIESVAFKGPHPAGLPSTHIHFLDPVNRNKTVWHVGLQDVIAIGRLFTTGNLDTGRIISLAGSRVKNPRMVRTRLGASVRDLVRNVLVEGPSRIISGSVFSGHTAHADLGYLGRYHQQVAVLPVDRERKFLGWLSPGWNLFSIKKIVLSGLKPGKWFDFTTNLHGGLRSIVPSGSYEQVMPLDILPTYLLRALAVQDLDEAEKLGCLELIEEDLGLCSFVCPAKIDHMTNLRKNLELIAKEG